MPVYMNARDAAKLQGGSEVARSRQECAGKTRRRFSAYDFPMKTRI